MLVFDTFQFASSLKSIEILPSCFTASALNHLIHQTAHLSQNLRTCLWAALTSMLLLASQAFANPPPAQASPDLYRQAMLAITEGRLADAEKALVTLSEESPRHAGAWMDLAMLSCAVGNATSAEALFVEIERRYDPLRPILDVIASQRALGCLGWQPAQVVQLRLGRGFESNVNQGARSLNFSIAGVNSQTDLMLLPEFLPQSDQFTNFSADVTRQLSPNGTTGVLRFQSKSYDRLSKYDTNSLFVSLERPWQWGDWGLRTAGTSALMTLGSQVYLKQNQLQLTLLPPLPLPGNWKFGVTESLSFISHPTLTAYDARWWETRGTLTYRGDASLWQASASAVQDSGAGQRPGGDRAGIFANLQGRFSLGRDVRGELSWQRQHWLGERAYFPGLIGDRRIQKTQVLRAAAVFPLSEQQAIAVEYRNTRNDENISIFNYRDQVLQLSWQWQSPQKR
jgi:hypothetical protein